MNKPHDCGQAVHDLWKRAVDAENNVQRYQDLLANEYSKTRKALGVVNEMLEQLTSGPEREDVERIYEILMGVEDE